MYILDTHTLLWYLTDSDKLPLETKNIITKDENVVISIASLWEITIKLNIGKLKFKESISDIIQLCNEKHFSILPILPKDLYILENLERIHNDPFDRIIICQTISNSATLITKDSIIPEYAIPTLWY